LAQIILAIVIRSTRSKNGDFNLFRFSLFLLFAFSAGINIGTWIQFGSAKAGLPITLNNALVYDSFTLTTILFVIFSIVGTLATPGILFLALSAIGIGGTVMFWTAIASLFGLTSLLAFNAAYINLGLIVASCYIVIDTWRINEEAKRGVRDVIEHSLTLLTDFITVFIRILYLLSRKNGKRENSSR